VIEAANTNASTAGIWAIVIVAVLALAFWLTAVILADRSQVRASGRAGIAGEPGPALSGAWAGGSVAGAQAPEIPGEAVHEPILVQEAGAQGGRAGDEAVPPGEVPTRADIPAQRPEGGKSAMPRQRAGDADRAPRSYAGRDKPDDEKPGR
jgi:hypothetical protein